MLAGVLDAFGVTVVDQDDYLDADFDQEERFAQNLATIDNELRAFAHVGRKASLS